MDNDLSITLNYEERKFLDRMCRRTFTLAEMGIEVGEKDLEKIKKLILKFEVFE
jgi:hypothetical protein